MSNQYLQINEKIETLIIPDDMNMKRGQSNMISTMQTSWITFLPYNLIKQLLQPSNIYFIIIGILQIIPATSYTGGVPVVYGPLIIVMFISMIKDALEEYQRYKSDQEENNKKTKRFINYKFEQSQWDELHQGDVICVQENQTIPSDILILSTSLEGGIAYVETKQIDGETNLKQKYSLPELQTSFSLMNCSKYNQQVTFNYEKKNPMLYKITGSYFLANSQASPIQYGNFIERGCILQNTKWIIGLCIYTGMDCKIMLNCAKQRVKRSRLENDMRLSIITIAFCLFAFCLFASTYEYFWTKKNISYDYLGLKPENMFIDIGLWFSLLSYFIPISLMVNVELVKFGQGKILQADKVIINSKANQSNLIEQLGEIDFVFTDKTGTLTQNKMIFKELDAINKQEALLCLSLCHSVIKSDDKLIGSSPDELAFLDYCKTLGIQYQGIDNQAILTVNNKQFKRHIIFDFSSEKKRMTILVQYQNDYIVYCKGADEIILELTNTKDNIYIKEQLRTYAVSGNRTLMLAKKLVDPTIAVDLIAKFKMAEEYNDPKMFDQIQSILEKDLLYLGITAVEDLLADEVALTIQSLRQANIKTWVLTGDKVETSISIGYSCGLIKETDQMQIISDFNRQVIEDVFLQYVNDQNNIALVISGTALAHMLEDRSLKQALLKKAMQSRVVIVARVSPKQKQQVVQLIQEAYPHVRTLAIGDGANDVSMITEANVGVGIQGVEGSQASRAADFSIYEFKYLRRLLFYYGVECSRRNALTILYIFYKNQVFISPYFWFGIFNGFSGQYLYDQWMQQLFNTVFASLPQILYALFDEMYPSNDYLQWSKTTHNQLESKPKTYIQYRDNPLFTFKKFWIWVFTGMAQGFIILMFCLALDSQNMVQGKTISLIETGVLVYGCTILLVNLKIFTFTYTNYNITVFVICLSIIIYWICLILVQNDEFSDSYDFYRLLKRYIQKLLNTLLNNSPQPYLAIVLTFNLFLIDLAVERHQEFQTNERTIENSIEMT